MKQIILHLFLLFLSFQVCRAQVSLSFTPNPIEASGFADPNDLFVEIVGYATVKNEGSETVVIRWERFFVEKPEEWEVQVCDLNQCYVPVVYSNIAGDLGLNAPVELAPGAHTNMDVHIQPKGVAGTAEIQIEVASAAAPDDIIVTGTYNFTAELLSSTGNASKARLAVFPNPATDYVEVRGAQNTDRLAIYSVLGRQLRSFNLASGSRYYIGDLPTGLYLASLINKNGNIVKTFRLSKRSARP